MNLESLTDYLSIQLYVLFFFVLCDLSFSLKGRKGNYSVFIVFSAHACYVMVPVRFITCHVDGRLVAVIVYCVLIISNCTLGYS